MFGRLLVLLAFYHYCCVAYSWKYMGTWVLIKCEVTVMSVDQRKTVSIGNAVHYRPILGGLSVVSSTEVFCQPCLVRSRSRISWCRLASFARHLPQPGIPRRPLIFEILRCGMQPGGISICQGEPARSIHRSTVNRPITARIPITQ